MHDDFIRDLFDHEAKACPVPPTTWGQIQRAALNRRSKHVRTARVGRRFLIGAVAGLAVVGGLGASGFVSPAMAKVLSGIPVVGVVWSPFGARQLKMAVPTDASATSDGVSFKVTRTFYDKNRLVVYYDLTMPDRDLAKAAVDIGPGSGSRSTRTDTTTNGAGDPNTTQVDPQLSFRNPDFLQVGGKPLRYNSMEGGGETKVGPNEYAGLLDVEGITDVLPDQAKLQITPTQIGRVQGRWSVTVPITSAATDAATTTYHPMATKIVADGVQLTVKQISVGPLNVAVDYELSQPVSKSALKYDLRGMMFSVYANGAYLEPTGGGVPVSQARNGRQIDDLRELYVTPTEPMSSMEIRPSYSDPNPVTPVLTTVSIPYTSSLPILLDQGSYGVSKITKVDFEANQTVVYEELSTKSLDHPPFWFKDGTGRTFKDTGQHMPDGGIIFPSMDPDAGLTIETQSAQGDIGGSHTLEQLYMTVPLK